MMTTKRCSRIAEPGKSFCATSTRAVNRNVSFVPITNTCVMTYGVVGCRSSLIFLLGSTCSLLSKSITSTLEAEL